MAMYPQIISSFNVNYWAYANFKRSII